jgi:tetratricopeptide (TPR) repeat protein
LLDDILAQEPNYAQAHNHLGWLFKHKFNNTAQAELHYKLAIQFNPNYPASHINYIYLLRDSGRLEELEVLIKKIEGIKAVSRSTYYDELASFYELKGDYKNAIENYKIAIKYTLSTNVIEDLRGHIKRCHSKADYFYGNRFVKAFKVLFSKNSEY